MTAGLAPSGIRMLDTASSVELAFVERGGMRESVHSGAAVLLSPTGAVLASLGDPTATVLPRSTLKPFQAIAAVRAGARVRGVELALATASHAGSDAHVAVVQGVLDTAGLTPDALGCPPARPASGADRAAHPEPRRIAMNCSGKHAAMLSACVVQGWPTDGYLDPTHPLQVQARAVVEEFAGSAVQATTVDGCGAPLFAIPLVALARAIGRFASSPDAAAAVIRDAVLAEPWAIDGVGRPNTVAIETLGFFAKGGAEGVIAVGLPDGHAVAAKVLDGSPRATTLVALELLVRAGLVPRDAADTVLDATLERITGGEEIVGRIVPAF